MTSYAEHYLWSDLELFESWLWKIPLSGPFVVEVASGPNIVVPYLLEKLGSDFTYLSVDINPGHLRLQSKGLSRKESAYAVQATARCLPVRNSVVDLFVFHHAVDDILETCGQAGVYDSIGEALRVVQPGGHIVFSHCVFDDDPFTSEISLEDVEEMLAEFDQTNCDRREAHHQEWLFVEVE